MSPLSRRGRKVKRAMIKEYGEKKGEQVFYATENKQRSLRKKKRK